MSEANGSGGVHTDPAALRELSEPATSPHRRLEDPVQQLVGENS